MEAKMKGFTLGVLFGIGIMFSGLAAAQVPAFVKTVVRQRGVWEKHIKLKAGESITINATGFENPMVLVVPVGKRAEITLQAHVEFFDL